jgi:hypothetical protein
MFSKRKRLFVFTLGLMAILGSIILQDTNRGQQDAERLAVASGINQGVGYALPTPTESGDLNRTRIEVQGRREIAAVIKGFEGYGDMYRPASGADVRIEQLDSKGEIVTLALDRGGVGRATLLGAGPWRITATFLNMVASEEIYAGQASATLGEIEVLIRFPNALAKVNVEASVTAPLHKGSNELRLCLRERAWQSKTSSNFFVSTGRYSKFEPSEYGPNLMASIEVDVPRPFYFAVVDDMGNILYSEELLPPLSRGEERNVLVSLTENDLPRCYEFNLDGEDTGIRLLGYKAYLFAADGSKIGFFPRQFAGGALELSLFPDEEYWLLFSGIGFAPKLLHLDQSFFHSQVTPQVKVPVQLSTAVRGMRTTDKVDGNLTARFISSRFGLTIDVPVAVRSDALIEMSRGVGAFFDYLLFDEKIYRCRMQDSQVYFLADFELVGDGDKPVKIEKKKIYLKSLDLSGHQLSVQIIIDGVPVSWTQAALIFGAEGGMIPIELPYGDFEVRVVTEEGTWFTGTGSFSGEEYAFVEMQELEK